MNVFSRLNTRAMKIPNGLVTAKISARKSRICSHPLTVMSEPLRTQQGVEQVHNREHTDHEHDDRFQTHMASLIPGGRKTSRSRLTLRRMRPIPQRRSGLAWQSPQNLTRIAPIRRLSSLTRSGVNPSTTDPGGP